MISILIRRSIGLGDVIMATPVVRRFLEDPDVRVFFSTFYPHVFDGLFDGRVEASSTVQQEHDFDRSVDLDEVYERSPWLHVTDAYMMEAFGNIGDSFLKQPAIRLEKPPIGLDEEPDIVVVHAARTWRSRTLPEKTWANVGTQLSLSKLKPFAVGKRSDILPSGCIDLRGRLTLHQVAGLIAGARCFLGSDSGLLHVAACTATPIVGVFTCARPERRLPYRNGILGGDCFPVVPALACVGCLERPPTPRTTDLCLRGDFACASMVDAQAIMDAVHKAAVVRERTAAA